MAYCYSQNKHHGNKVVTVVIMLSSRWSHTCKPCQWHLLPSKQIPWQQWDEGDWNITICLGQICLKMYLLCSFLMLQIIPHPKFFLLYIFPRMLLPNAQTHGFLCTLHKNEDAHGTRIGSDSTYKEHGGLCDLSHHLTSHPHTPTHALNLLFSRILLPNAQIPWRFLCTLHFLVNKLEPSLMIVTKCY